MSNAAQQPCRGLDAGEGSLLGDGDLGQDGFPELLQCPHRRNERARGKSGLPLQGRSLLGSWLRHNGIGQGSKESLLESCVGRLCWARTMEVAMGAERCAAGRGAAERERRIRERLI